MKKILLVIGVILLGLSSCHSGKKGNALLSRSFPTYNWERFDFVKTEIDLKKPTTYNLVLNVAFDPSYTQNYFSVVFTVFDENEHPFRTKGYKFTLKEKDGSWKSTLTDGSYHYSFPINSELSINEPGKYTFQLENRMPITPLTGIQSIEIINLN
ncbi:MAG: hypothetical protein IKM99_02740 [Bacteroidales bacterium]|nr:hypothetical protein [Bacteroidales bacterium]